MPKTDVVQGFECRDCGHVFETGEDFSNHFRRDGAIITGCQHVPNKVKQLRKKVD
jgi:hypothetical protein